MLFKKVNEEGFYYFDLYEKWWYCFFLIFAWYLPHRCYKWLEQDQLNSQSSAPEKKQKWWSAVVGTIIGVSIPRFIPKDVWFIIEKENFWVYLLTLYLVLVLFAFISRQVIRKNHDNKICTEDFLTIRFKRSLKPVSLKFYALLVFVISFIFSFKSISPREFMMFMVGCIFFTFAIYLFILG